MTQLSTDQTVKQKRQHSSNNVPLEVPTPRARSLHLAREAWGEGPEEDNRQPDPNLRAVSESNAKLCPSPPLRSTLKQVHRL